MAAVGGQQLQEMVSLKNNQLCVAVQHFEGQQEGDLSFGVGDKIRIIKPSSHMFWYEARNENGKVGVVPSNFLKPLEDEGPIINSESGGKGASKDSSRKESTGDDGYLHMNPQDINLAKRTEMEVMLAQEKEQRRRLRPGTLVVGTCPFVAQEKTDLSFDVYEEMNILHPLPDLCWYFAQKTDQPSKKGAIPVTHVRLVYLSEDEDDCSQDDPGESSHDRLYEDADEFISQSGWFSFPGLPHCKEALYHVLAKKCKMSYEDFMACKEAVYYFDYINGEKKFVGKAHVLHEELAIHFDQFEKKEGIRELDDELCHHTGIAGWEIMVWPIQEEQDLEKECAKRIIELDALGSKESDSGITDYMEFTSYASFQKFWEWFAP